MHKNKKIIFFSHLLIWFVLFSLPYILSYGQEQEINRIIAHFWIPLFFYAIIFYLNYFVFIDRFLFAKKTLQFIVINLLIIAVFLLSKEQIEQSFFQELVKRPRDSTRSGPPLKMLIYVQMLSYMAPLLFSIAIKTTQRWARTEAERKEAANIKLRSELQHLRYQLQPHFFLTL